MSTPAYVAINLLESMIDDPQPTRAEINDVITTSLMVSKDLFLTGEPALGRFSFESVRTIEKLIVQLEKWTENSSIEEILNS